MNRIFFAACLLGTGWISTGCGLFESEKGFERMAAAHTGIRFNNQITESDTFNVLRFEYIYNGGGVGVGDVNNDGLTDVFFAGNQVSSELYLNRGDFKFENVTEAAGVRTNRWCTGVALADVNQDGWLDIYVSTVHPHKDKSVPNLLFLNRGADAKGNVRFEEVAARVGLADSSYATQAVFFDYDRDGDLDCYLLNNSLEDYNRNQPVGQRTDGSGKSVDRLYQNTGPTADGLPVFQNVSKQAGIQTEGWGLGVVVNDINQDGWPDVYVANDFLSNDHLWINNRNGTFTNRLKQYFKHTEHNGMGVDIADINNDGLNDVVAVDMMPDDNLRQKTMFSSTGYDRFFTNLRQSYLTQYVRNTLQINNGPSPVADSSETPVTFSDIGYLAGIYATDWSWSSLLADFDNDGHRDLLITNGYRKDVTDLDFVTYSNDAAMFGTDETRLQKAIETVNGLEGVKKPNFLYRNKGDLTFEDMTEPWGLKIPSFSNGAAYADFDNDGDLDLVMNNINDEAFVYRNNLLSGQRAEGRGQNNFLRIKLKGDKGNTTGVGAKVWLHYAGQTQYAEHQLQRGYKSSVEDAEHFGLGNHARLDSVVVLWPGGKRQRLANVNANQTLTLSEKDAVPAGSGIFNLGKNQPKRTSTTWFAEVAKEHGLAFRHQEEDFPDFKSGQALLPRKHSQQGPAAAVGDINGDGLDDVFLGGPARRPGVFFVQKPNGTFVKSLLEDSVRAKTAEDAGVLLFDADNDGDNDLYCASGSSEFGKNLKNYRHRFYRNQGKGNFQLDSAALPVVETSGSVVTAADFDRDGDLDLFIGGRILPTRYPYPPRSYLLQNDGKGRFRDITPQAAPDLQTPGMVTAALWTDYDNDNWPDLLLVGEWMPITLLKNEGGKTFTHSRIHAFTHSVGWWNSLAAGDFDNDGDTDYVAGNLGRNSLYQASEKEPVCVYAK
nr:VCBS repeat-containing protein [Cytophagales bacterium]